MYFQFEFFLNRHIPLSRATPSSFRIPAEDVPGYVLTHRESSVRDISKARSYSKSTVWNILYMYDAYPYCPVLAQELMSGDQKHRFDFCNFVLNTLDENPDSFNEVLWSDECQFSRQGTVNTQNTHYWSLENSRSSTTESPPSAFVQQCVVRNMEEHHN
ncbi:DUF4817 domain-containing protein [Trichonephila clavipes]|uniref:DUF4817 domain-containing protein n=1 Tax=Trichonephila clavipes TaxID=2585209 RepID=A0A8X6S1E1_TRICX|nr:DUF4817 domain-containing protein [Trichonephila clavipes]